MKKSLKHLSFESLRKCLTRIFQDIPDRRQKSKIKHELHDVVMSGFAMMYFQDPSLLQFQRRLREDEGSDNLATLFEVKSVPEDTQMRSVLNQVDPELFRPAFKNFFHRLQRGKQLEPFRLFDNSYLVVSDGSGFFSSKQVNCSGCLTKKHANGETTYQHQLLMSAIVHPDIRQVIPLMPEEIRNTDGSEKQDCEINAGKRYIQKLRKDHPHLKITLGWDSIASKQPFVEAVRAEGMNFIFVAKPNDHITMMEWVSEQRQLGEVGKKRVVEDRKREGKYEHVYEWVNQVPLNGNPDTVLVNYFQYEMICHKKEERKVVYRNAWVTDFKVDSQNIVNLVRAGRCRWKIENECFNTLKNQGYSIEHNYGHGTQHLAFNFLILTLLAFFFHQISELTDRLYQACRMKLGSKRELWSSVRNSIRIFVFKSWEQLFEFTLNPKSFQPILIKPG